MSPKPRTRSGPRARYDMKGDAVIAALPEWRGAHRGNGREGARQAGIVGEAAFAGRPPVQDHGGADQLRASISRKCAARTDIPQARRRIARRISSKAGIFLKANSSIVGPSEGIPIRFPDRINEHEIELVIIIGKQGSDIPKDKTRTMSPAMRSAST